MLAQLSHLLTFLPLFLYQVPSRLGQKPRLTTRMVSSKLLSWSAAERGNNTSKLPQQKLEKWSISLAFTGLEKSVSTGVYSSNSKASLVQAFRSLLVLFFPLKGHDEHNQTSTARCLAQQPVRTLRCQKLSFTNSWQALPAQTQSPNRNGHILLT